MTFDITFVFIVCLLCKLVFQNRVHVCVCECKLITLD